MVPPPKQHHHQQQHQQQQHHQQQQQQQQQHQHQHQQQHQQYAYYGYSSFPSGELPAHKNPNSGRSRDFVHDSIASNGFFKGPSDGARFQGESHHPPGFDLRRGHAGSISPIQSFKHRGLPDVHANLHDSHADLRISHVDSHVDSHCSHDAYSRSQPHPDSRDSHSSHDAYSRCQPHPDSHNPHSSHDAYSRSQPHLDSHRPHPHTHSQQIPHTPLHQHPNRQQLQSYPQSNHHSPQGTYSHDRCAQPLPQQQILCQSATQQREVLPLPTPSSHVQSCDANTIAVGVPVGRPIYMNNPYVISPPSMPPMQQPLSHWPRNFGQSAPVLAAIPMPSVGSFTSSQTCNQMDMQSDMVETQGCLDGTRYANFQGINQLQYNGSKTSITQLCARNEVIPLYKSETQLSADLSIRSDSQGNIHQHHVADCNIERKWATGLCKLSNGHYEHKSSSGGKTPGSPMKADHSHQKFPRKDSFTNGRQFSSTRRNDRHLEPQVRNRDNQAFSRRDQNEMYYSKDTDGALFNRSRGYPEEKRVGGRSMNCRPQQQLHCDPCERTFGNRGDLDAHLNSHVKCGEEGCTFEASGKIVKEHKVVEHGKINAPTTAKGRKAAALRLTEDKEEVVRWRQERKKNYPTSANILQKTEQRKKREAEGIFFDEELQKRHLQMKEVLEKQRRLGFQAAEIPPKYFIPHDRERRQRPIRNAQDKEQIIPSKRPCSAGDAERPMDGEGDNLEKTVDSSHEIVENGLSHRLSKQQNAPGRESLPKRKRRKQQRTCMPDDDERAQIRQPTLLSKLLERDIMKENSYLLQCCRFVVNNSFLQHASSTLNHFSWIMEPCNAAANDERKMPRESSEDSLSREDIHTSDVCYTSPLLLREDFKAVKEGFSNVEVLEK